ncbi:hypothetical protein [Micromonospora tarensis]|uniref:Uncharacterized protein n=1 Tax=Micromonospora tarensis TaxID=2806100 RepID=A0ABS1YRT4_9ACTN|nr:hypothetical protein [Micromonospora tarensis]MBM0280130.1 hypothetical protein [Micromonospora tarensis]
MATGTSGNRLRRLALPTLAFALVIGTAGVARPASAAPAGASGNGSGAGYFTAGSDKRVTLTDGADRRPDGRNTTGQRAADETRPGRYIVELRGSP